MSRDEKDTAGMRKAIAAERDTVRTLIPLRGQDSRIGFEASNQYYYTLRDLVEKLINLDWLEKQLNR